MQHLLVTPKLTWLPTLFLAAAVSILNIAQASPYVINMEDSFTYHWDEYVYRYTPDAGWAGEIQSGNNAEFSSVLEVLANDGSAGQVIDLKLSFRITWRSHYFDDGMDPDEMSNFAGSSGAQISNSVFAWNANFHQSSFGEKVTKPFDTSGSHISTKTVPFVVGPLVWGDFDNGIFTDTNGHTKFIPDELFVHDPTKPAAAGFYTEVGIYLIDAEIVGVPESGSILFMMGVSLAGLLLLNRHRRSAA